MYIILKGQGSDVLNMHAPTEYKSDNTKDSSYEEPEHVFNQFPKYHIAEK
jgi:hypothetical protein